LDQNENQPEQYGTNQGFCVDCEQAQTVLLNGSTLIIHVYSPVDKGQYKKKPLIQLRIRGTFAISLPLA
jgi:hypothetical protein